MSGDSGNGASPPVAHTQCGLNQRVAYGPPHDERVDSGFFSLEPDRRDRNPAKRRENNNAVRYPGVTPKQKGLAAELLTPWNLVELSGVEPLTSCMPCKRSTN